MQANGCSDKEVKKRVQAGWANWRKMTGLICDRRVPAKIKGKVYKSTVRPAMMYGLETVPLTGTLESKLQTTEMNMLRWSLGVTRRDKVRNEVIRGTIGVGSIVSKLRESRLRWFGHVERREENHVTKRVMNMELPGSRRRGRPKKRWIDCVNEDMRELGLSREEAQMRGYWRNAIRCGDPC